MANDKRTDEDGPKDEPARDANRRTDIEDQGQTIDAVGEVDPDVEPVEGDDSDPGPENVGAREATQQSGEAPTEIIDEGTETDDE